MTVVKSIRLGPNSPLRSSSKKLKLGFTESQLQSMLVGALVGKPKKGQPRTLGEGMTGKYPELWLLYAIPNQRAGLAAGGRMKAEGQLKSMLDLCLPVSRAGWHSLYLETKLPGEKLRPDQESTAQALRVQGHAVIVWRDLQEGVDAVRQYLDLPACDELQGWHRTDRDAVRRFYFTLERLAK